MKNIVPEWFFAYHAEIVCSATTRHFSCSFWSNLASVQPAFPTTMTQFPFLRLALLFPLHPNHLPTNQFRLNCETYDEQFFFSGIVNDSGFNYCSTCVPFES
jgi:hypothetical protein